MKEVGWWFVNIWVNYFCLWIWIYVGEGIMISFFICCYVGVFMVLFLVWFVYGVVFECCYKVDFVRVFFDVYGGGVCFVVEWFNEYDDV